VESNGQSHSPPPIQHRLADLRLNDNDRMLGKRYVEQGDDLADLAIRAAHGIRTLLGNAGKALRIAFAHKHHYAKNGAVQGD